ncbi:hypothetical protein [Clostridium beijerinckii]|nr:hypothetical protein [Clostridium beijerinckii]
MSVIIVWGGTASATGIFMLKNKVIKIKKYYNINSIGLYQMTARKF